MRDHVLTLNGLGVSQNGNANRADPNGNARGGQMPGANARRKESIEFRLLYGVTFAVFLVAALVEAINPFRSRQRDQKSESIIQKARFGAETCVKYAFMG
ncbi:MAG: hypothetical protein ACKVP5_04425 [Aestuariivirga sp.]